MMHSNTLIFAARRLAALLWLAGLMAPCAAQTLPDLLREAYLANPGVDAAQAATLGKNAQVEQERARMLPQLTYQIDARRVDNTVSRGRGSQYDATNGTLGLRQTVFNWGEWQTFKQSQLGVSAAEVNLAQVRQALRLRLALAYFSLLGGREEVALSEQRIAILTQFRHGVQRRFEEGRATVIETTQAESELLAARMHALAAQGQRDLAGGELDALVGRPLAQESAAPLQGEPTPPEFSEHAMAAWLAQAREADFEVQKKRIGLAMAERERAKAKGEFLPSMQLTASRASGRSIYATGVESNTVDARQSSTVVGVSLALPLFNGLGSRARLSQAGHLVEQAAAELGVARREAGVLAAKAYLASRTGAAQIAAGGAAVRSAEAVFAAVAKGYELGRRSFSDVNIAEEKLFQARRDLVRARYDFLSNLARLRASVAALDDADLARLAGSAR